jgi:hypothetical protein
LDAAGALALPAEELVAAGAVEAADELEEAEAAGVGAAGVLGALWEGAAAGVEAVSGVADEPEGDAWAAGEACAGGCSTGVAGVEGGADWAAVLVDGWAAGAAGGEGGAG